ncbi:hypothetical protein D3C78_1399400 [compost metagenome]
MTPPMPFGSGQVTGAGKQPSEAAQTMAPAIQATRRTGMRWNLRPAISAIAQAMTGRSEMIAESPRNCITISAKIAPP